MSNLAEIQEKNTVKGEGKKLRKMLSNSKQERKE